MGQETWKKSMDLKKGKLYRAKMHMAISSVHGTEKYETVLWKDTIVMFLEHVSGGIHILVGEQVSWVDKKHFYYDKPMRVFEEVTG